jgi:hypothetical protein
MKDVTYGMLDRVLRSLGFTCSLLRQEPAARWYKHPATGAVVSLPLLPETEHASPHDIAAVQGTLKVFGIADPLAFAAELQKAG